MDLSSMVNSFGASLYDALTDRFMAGEIYVCSAWLRPHHNIYAPKVDVTQKLIDMMAGGITIDMKKILPSDLLRGRAKFEWMRFRKPRVAVDNEPHWLCISYKNSGGAMYIICYSIPDELVTFPPPSKFMHNRIIPLDRQIMFASITIKEDDETEGENIISIDHQMRMMLGPMGDAFGREWISMEILLADILEKIENPLIILRQILTSAFTRGTIAFNITTTDGVARPVVNMKWHCPGQPPLECKKET